MSAQKTVAAGQPCTLESPTVGYLTVVAGPTAVGKSHFIERLRRDDVLRARFAIPPDFRAFGASSPRLRTTGEIRYAVLHYDFLRPFHRNLGTYEHDPGTLILRSVERVTFLTMHTTRARLLAQLDRRIAEKRGSTHRLQRLYPLYESGAFLADWYRRWLRFVNLHSTVARASLLVDGNGGYVQTEAQAARCYGGSSELPSLLAASPTV